jgi:hypothetical protein
MPTSLTPPPADDEIECANCGKYFHIELTRCPHCGINIYEPEEAKSTRPPAFRAPSKFSRALASFARTLRGLPDPAEELFAGALREKALYDDLLRKVGGDRAVVERLIEFEGKQTPAATRYIRLQNAIRRWERENQ